GSYSELADLCRWLHATITTKPHAAALCGLQRVLGPLADHAALFLGNHGHDAHGEAVGRRHVGRDEVDAGLVQAQQEMGIAREAIQLGDDQLGAVGPASLQRRLKLGSIRPLAALDLHELLDQRPVAAVQELSDAIALSLK